MSGTMIPILISLVTFFSELGISYMGLRFSMEIGRDVYRIALRGDSSNVLLYVDDVEQDISFRKQCKFKVITLSLTSIPN